MATGARFGTSVPSLPPPSSLSPFLPRRCLALGIAYAFARATRGPCLSAKDREGKTGKPPPYRARSLWRLNTSNARKAPGISPGAGVMS